MTTPPNLRDVSKGCCNCDDCEVYEDGSVFCENPNHVYKLEHPFFLCDDWRNE
jgi:hypothetical protein